MTPAESLDKLNELWAQYRSRPVDMTIHSDERMASVSPEIYRRIGESAAKVIYTTFALAHKHGVCRGMDFGCGHGRVGRHLRAFLPDSELFFVDVVESGREFCAKQFNGKAVSSGADFSNLDLPGDMDLIWVGSVFTHMDYARMRMLFDSLVASLSRNGILIMTLRGRELHQRDVERPAIAKNRSKLLKEYEQEGIGYQSYRDINPNATERYDENYTGDWGLSLISPAKAIELGLGGPARLLLYSEAAWARQQDVAAWIRP